MLEVCGELVGCLPVGQKFWWEVEGVGESMKNTYATFGGSWRDSPGPPISSFIVCIRLCMQVFFQGLANWTYLKVTLTSRQYCIILYSR